MAKLMHVFALSALLASSGCKCKQEDGAFKNRNPQIEMRERMAGYNPKNYDPNTPTSLINAVEGRIRELIGILNNKPTLDQKLPYVQSFASMEMKKIRAMKFDSLGIKEELAVLLGKQRADALFTRIGEMYYKPAPYSKSDQVNKESFEPLFAKLFPEFVDYIFQKASMSSYDSGMLNKYGSMANRIALEKYPLDKKVLLEAVKIAYPEKRKVLVEGIRKILEDKTNLESESGRRKIGFALLMVPHTNASELMPSVRRFATDPAIATRFPAIKQISGVMLQEMEQKNSAKNMIKTGGP